MKAKVVIKEEVGINFPEDWVLTFQKVIYILLLLCNFPGGSDGKASAYNAGDLG